MLDSGYSLIIIDTFTATVNPTTNIPFHAEKKSVDIPTLTATVTQHWSVRDSDKTCWMRWENISKSEVDALVTLFEASYTSYNYTDEYGDSHDVVITSMPHPKRRDSIDSRGYSLELTLKKV